MRPIAVLHVTSAEGGGADRYLRDLAATTAARHWIWHAAARIVEDAVRPTLPERARRHGAGALARCSGHRPCAPAWRHARRPCRAGARARGTRAAVRRDAARHRVHSAARIRRFARHRRRRIARVAAHAGAGRARRRAIVLYRGAGRRALRTRRRRRDRTGHRRGARSRARAARKAGDDFAAHAHPRRIAVVGALGAHKGSADLARDRALRCTSSRRRWSSSATPTRSLQPGWQVQGELFIHGAYEDHALPGAARPATASTPCCSRIASRKASATRCPKHGRPAAR